MTFNIFLKQVTGNSFDSLKRLSEISVTLYDRKRRLVENDIKFNSPQQLKSPNFLESLLTDINNDSIKELEIRMIEEGFVIYFDHRPYIFMFN